MRRPRGGGARGCDGVEQPEPERLKPKMDIPKTMETRTPVLGLGGCTGASLPLESEELIGNPLMIQKMLGTLGDVQEIMEHP